jgi:hypothetical protein
MNTALENEVAKRFGVLPNFFRLAPQQSDDRREPLGIRSVRISGQSAPVPF